MILHDLLPPQREQHYLLRERVPIIIIIIIIHLFAINKQTEFNTE